MNIASYIDHTLLKPTVGRTEIISLCNEALENSFAAVCINSHWVPLAVDILLGSDINVCTVTGFPLGASSTDVKLAETSWCLENGAREIDTVMNIGEAKNGNWDFVEDEIAQLANLVHAKDAILKVIFENCLLENNEIVSACQACVSGGADFVKTSTGFSSGGATEEDVALMVKTVAGQCKVKAAGGVRTAEQAIRMIEIGAARLGTSSGVAIISGGTAEKGY